MQRMENEASLKSKNVIEAEKEPEIILDPDSLLETDAKNSYRLLENDFIYRVEQSKNGGLKYG